jgi:cytochrome c oxidase subunit II
VRRPTRLVLISMLLGALGLAVAAPGAAAIPLAPESPNSPNAEDLRTAYDATVLVAILLALAINVALILAVVRFRATRDAAPVRTRGTGRIQARVATVLGAIALAIFIFGLVIAVKARDIEASGPEGLQASELRFAQLGLQPPEGDAEPLEIEVSGQQWLWRYEYPDGTFSYYELVVPVDTAVVLRLLSTDVTHRWWVPALGGKFDAVPGRANTTWFKAEEEGEYCGQSAQFNGPAYPTMRACVTVVGTTEYEAWLGDQAAAIQQAQEAVQREIEAGALQSAEPEAKERGEAFEEGAAPPKGEGPDDVPTEEVAPEDASAAPGGGDVE